MNAAKGTLSLYFVRNFDARLPHVTRIVRIDLGRQTIRDRTYEGAERLLLLCRSAYAEAGHDRDDRADIEGRVLRLLNLSNGIMTVRHGDVARALQGLPPLDEASRRSQGGELARRDGPHGFVPGFVAKR